jgi:predicted nucleic acid-binding protein
LPIAKRAGEIEGQAQASDPNDSGVGAADAIIAATALVLDEPVMTDDRRDFANRMQNDLSLNDLRVEVYT